MSSWIIICHLVLTSRKFVKSYSRGEINKTHLPYDGLRILVNALVISRLDYCNSRYLASLSVKGINLNEFRMLRLVL